MTSAVRQRYELSATQTLGNDDAARVTPVFSDKTVEVKFEAAAGFKVTLTGRTDD